MNLFKVGTSLFILTAITFKWFSGPIVMDKSGYTEKGFKRKIAVQALFGKVFYLSEVSDHTVNLIEILFVYFLCKHKTSTFICLWYHWIWLLLFLVIGFLKQISGNHNTEIKRSNFAGEIIFVFFFNLKCVREILKRLHLV